MWLMLGDVELAERQRELDRVPVVEHARAIRPAGEEGDQGQSKGDAEIGERLPARAQGVKARAEPGPRGVAHAPAHTRSAVKIPAESPTRSSAGCGWVCRPGTARPMPATRERSVESSGATRRPSWAERRP